jgi:capsular polysaccharide biosynthesis protein
MVSVFIIFLVEYFDNTIKMPDEIEQRLGLPVLGSVPDFDE